MKLKKALLSLYALIYCQFGAATNPPAPPDIFQLQCEHVLKGIYLTHPGSICLSRETNAVLFSPKDYDGCLASGGDIIFSTNRSYEDRKSAVLNCEGNSQSSIATAQFYCDYFDPYLQEKYCFDETSKRLLKSDWTPAVRVLQARVSKEDYAVVVDAEICANEDIDFNKWDNFPIPVMVDYDADAPQNCTLRLMLPTRLSSVGKNMCQSASIYYPFRDFWQLTTDWPFEAHVYFRGEDESIAYLSFIPAYE